MRAAPALPQRPDRFVGPALPRAAPGPLTHENMAILRLRLNEASICPTRRDCIREPIAQRWRAHSGRRGWCRQADSGAVRFWPFERPTSLAASNRGAACGSRCVFCLPIRTRLCQALQRCHTLAGMDATAYKDRVRADKQLIEHPLKRFVHSACRLSCCGQELDCPRRPPSLPVREISQKRFLNGRVGCR